MDLKEFLEYPLPIIQIDIDKIAINMNEKNSGVINIKNVGGGTLLGDIVSNTDCIILDTEEFSGNNISIGYSVVPAIYSSGDFIKSEITIISNGGSINIPVYINISNFDYLKCNQEKIYTIKEFYQYLLNSSKLSIKTPTISANSIGLAYFFFFFFLLSIFKLLF